MTVLEMQQLFQTLLETTNSLYNVNERPDTDTILRYLNYGQVAYIKDKYLSAPTFVERTQVLGNNINDLGTLVTNIVIGVDTVTPQFDYSKTLVDTTNSYWHVINIMSTISRTAPEIITLKKVQLQPINIENINRYLTTINNIPIILVPVYFQMNPSESSYNEFIVIYDKYTGFNPSDAAINMVYLKKPKTLVLDYVDTSTTLTCELADYLHVDIVKYSLSLFEQEKYKLISKNK